MQCIFFCIFPLFEFRCFSASFFSIFKHQFFVFWNLFHLQSFIIFLIFLSCPLGKHYDTVGLFLWIFISYTFYSSTTTKLVCLNRQVCFTVRYKNYLNISRLTNPAHTDQAVSIAHNKSSHDGYSQKAPLHQVFAGGSFCAHQYFFIIWATNRKFRSISIFRASKSPLAAKAK